MGHMNRRGWGVAAILVLAASIIPCARLAAHPAAFDTFTVDLIVSHAGLEAIDIAVVPGSGPSYEPFPTAETKEIGAARVIDALDLERHDLRIVLELSDRYHQVGSSLHLTAPIAVQPPALLAIDVAPLLDAAEALGMGQLRLSVCAVETYRPASSGSPLLEEPSPELLSQLFIIASQPGRMRTDRAACKAWSQAPTDDPIILTLGQERLASTGVAWVGIGWTAGALSALGLALVTAGHALAGVRPRRRLVS